jgi:hypothetical protein
VQGLNEFRGRVCVLRSDGSDPSDDVWFDYGAISIKDPDIVGVHAKRVIGAWLIREESGTYPVSKDH